MQLSKIGNEGAALLTSATEPSEQAIREQLVRILASSLFRHSRRYTEFLRYTVEHALKGDAEDLKERTIGVEAFGKSPVYDTSQDPVVRVTAGEVRKRLAQYYQAPHRETEIRIEFCRGSYIPEFRQPHVSDSRANQCHPTDSHENDSASSRAVERALDHPEATPSNSKVLKLLVVFSVSAAAFCALLGWRLAPRETAFDLFWKPILGSPRPALLCVSDGRDIAQVLALQLPAGTNVSAHRGEGGNRGAPIGETRDPINVGRVWFPDAESLSMLAGALTTVGKSFRIRSTAESSLQDLSQGPVVLVGALNNKWTLKLGDQLRFTFVNDGETRYVKDKQNPESKNWGLSADQIFNNTSQDYAIISRVSDPTTGNFLITSAGIGPQGTGVVPWSETNG